MRSGAPTKEFHVTSFNKYKQAFGMHPADTARHPTCLSRLNRGGTETWGGCWLGAPGGAPGLFYVPCVRNKMLALGPILWEQGGSGGINAERQTS